MYGRYADEHVNAIEIHECVDVLTEWPLPLLQRPLVQDVSIHGQEEGDGLAAACLGDADHVRPGPDRT